MTELECVKRDNELLKKRVKDLEAALAKLKREYECQGTELNRLAILNLGG